MYLLFAGDDYYPEGGCNDLKGKFQSVDDAVKRHDPNKFEYDGGWANILNIETMKCVAKFSRGTWFYEDEELRFDKERIFDFNYDFDPKDELSEKPMETKT